MDRVRAGYVDDALEVLTDKGFSSARWERHWLETSTRLGE